MIVFCCVLPASNKARDDDDDDAVVVGFLPLFALLQLSWPLDLLLSWSHSAFPVFFYLPTLCLSYLCIWKQQFQNKHINRFKTILTNYETQTWALFGVRFPPSGSPTDWSVHETIGFSRGLIPRLCHTHTTDNLHRNLWQFKATSQLVTANRV